MKICIVGHLDSNTVEGTRRVFGELSRALTEIADVRAYGISDIGALKNAKAFSPDVLHAVIGPSSWRSVLALRAWKSVIRPRVLSISAVHCTISSNDPTLHLIRPDIVFAQSPATRRMLSGIGWRAYFLPNGVDTKRFVPLESQERERLRNEAGLPHGDLLLHVGPIKYARNVHWLSDLIAEGPTILIVSRPMDPGDPELISALREQGAIIWFDYFQNIAGVFQICDGFLFPALNPKSCIETPLSVLEAGSCNLPIITTPFGSLPTLLTDTQGVKFVTTREELKDEVSSFHHLKGISKTRETILSLDWSKICSRMVSIFESFILARALEGRG